MHLQPPQVPSSIMVREPVIGSQWAPLLEAEHMLVVPGEPQSRRQDGGPAAGSGLAALDSPPSIASPVGAVGAARIAATWTRNPIGAANWIHHQLDATMCRKPGSIPSS
ncbi:hypothetical protein SAMD00023353_0800790 [Rosellinia necatrix]|uniref:Uncharacterized protein n=1 Tax=Rosellinia necatrix TaxID=77044 RepID=A0A1S8A5Z7_ROSNE|nr:hypothetical protein SAMD00023353_0800790 [Rosellinia necatrix]